MDHTVQELPRLPRPQIIQYLEEVTREIASLRTNYGIEGRLSDFNLFLKPKDGAPNPGKILLVSKHHLARLITKYEKVFPTFKDLPPHARIGIDVHGREYQTPRFEVHCLEASLFEDMAAIWNAVADIPPDAEKPPLRDVQLYKLAKALQRATIRCAFALIEGYLNGLAMDIYLSADPSAKTLEKLTEWDQAASKPRPLPLKEKITQYPKIAKGADTPPISAATHKQVARLLEIERLVRHALIHPTPMGRGPAERKTWREEAYMDVDRDQVEEICDLVTGVIQEIDKLLDRKFGTVSFWLLPREGSHYPTSVFR